MGFFKKDSEWHAKLQPEPVNWPSGTCVRTWSGKHWYIKGKSKFFIPTYRVLDSWKFNSIAFTHDENLDGYKNAGTLGFREGTLIWNYADSHVYLISDNKRRHVTNPDAYEKYGINESNIVEVSNEEANLHDDGEVLN